MGRRFFTLGRSASRGRGCFSDVPGQFSVLPLKIALLAILAIAALLQILLPCPAPAAPSETGSPTFSWPCRGPVSRPFRSASGSYGQGGHAGIDIDVPAGTTVTAAAAGTVTFAGNTPLGLCVSVSHSGGLKTTYVSLAGCAVRAGARVERGARVGTSDGSRDRSSSSPHLHFGAALNGLPVDPMMLLEGRLLDPSRDLFLGPWDDQRSLEALFQGAGEDRGLLGSIGAGISAAGRAVAGAAKSCWNAVAAGAKWVGRGCAGFYRACIEPWAGGFVGKVGDACRAIISNRYVQAMLAALVAIAVIVVVVLAIAFTFGMATPLVVAAIVAGAVAAIGYAEYYAYAAGDAFSFTQCLTGCLVVGGAVALGVLCLGQSWSLVSAGWSKVGLLGFAKSFLAHGLADSLSYAVINGIAGRPFSWKTFALTFVLGGLCGGTGKLFVTGLSENLLQGLAAGSFTAGQMGSESFYVLRSSVTLLKDGGFAALAKAGAYQLGTAMAEKLTYMTFCGCTAFLTDFSIRLATGCSLSLGESLLSFGTGFCMGGISISSATLSPARILSNAACVYKPMGTEFVKNYVKKTASKGGKELLKARYGGGEEKGWEILPARE